MHNVREILPQKFENGKKKLFITRCFLVSWMKNINNNNIPGFTYFQVTFHMTTSFRFHLKIRMAHTETLLYSLCQLPFIFFNIMSKNSCLWIPNLQEFKLLYYIQTIIIGNIVNIYGILYLFHCFFSSSLLGLLFSPIAIYINNLCKFWYQHSIEQIPSAKIGQIRG